MLSDISVIKMIAEKNKKRALALKQMIAENKQRALAFSGKKESHNDKSTSKRAKPNMPDSGNGLDPPTPDVCSNKVNSRSSQDEKEEKLQIGMLPIGSTPMSTSQGATACSVMVDVNGYKVKASTAPILETIFAKHGDIAANCLYKSAAVKASLLEVVCNVVHRVQSNDMEILISELKNMEDEVSDAEAAKLDVSWLRENLAKMHEVEEVRKRSSLLKEAKVKIILLKKAAANKLERSRVELLAAKEQFREAENFEKALNLVERKLRDEASETEAEEYFWRRRLDGPL